MSIPLWQRLHDSIRSFWRRRRAGARPLRREPRRPCLEPLEERAVPALVSPPAIVTGPDVGLTPQVRAFDALTGTQQTNFVPFRTSSPQALRVAVGDVDGDGVADIITGNGPGRPPTVRVFSGQSQSQIAVFQAYSRKMRGGVFITVGNFDGDAALEVAVGSGNGSRVRIFNITGGSAIQIPGPLGSFLFFADQPRVGVRVAAGNIDGQAGDELIVAQGQGVQPRVVVFSTSGAQLTSFLAYDSSFRGGLYLAAGDVDGNGQEEIITGPGPGMETQVRVFNSGGSQIRNFRAFDPSFTGGARVAAVDADGDDRADIVVGQGPGDQPLVVVVDGQSLAQLDTFFAYDQSFQGGIYVAGT